MPWNDPLHRCAPKSPDYAVKANHVKRTIAVGCPSCLAVWEHPNGGELYHFYKMGFSACRHALERMADEVKDPNLRKASADLFERLGTSMVKL